jgi:hypothetical protein
MSPANRRPCFVVRDRSVLGRAFAADDEVVRAIDDLCRSPVLHPQLLQILLVVAVVMVLVNLISGGRAL